MVDHRLVFIAHENPCRFPAFGPDDVLGELTEATDKEWMPEYNAPGAGAFRINRHSEQYAWCVPGNYIRVYRDSVAGDLLGGFFLETGSDTVVSIDEEGGEIVELAGRGSMIILERAKLAEVSYLANGGDLGALPANDPDGMWHWTDRPPGAILVRQLEEAQARGDPDPLDNSTIPPVTWDFTRTLDSNGDGWSSSAGDLFKLAVGISIIEAIELLKEVDLIVYMDGNFNLFAWDTDQGVDRTADIVFAKGSNIRGDATVDREIQQRITMTHALVQGDLDGGLLTYANVIPDSDVLEDAAGRIEGFVQYPYTPSEDKLERAGLRAINRGNNAYQGVDHIPVLEREDEIPLLHYFPGDTVMALGLEERIRKIRFFDRDNDEYDVDIQFELAGYGLGGGRRMSINPRYFMPKVLSDHIADLDSSGHSNAAIARIVAPVAIANTETVVTSDSMVAGYMAVGTTFRVHAFGRLTSGATGGSSIFRVRIGTTTLTGNIPATLTIVNANTVTDAPFRLDALVTVRTAGATGTATGNLSAIGGIVGAFTVAGDVSAVSATVVVDTTATKLIELTYISGNAGTTATFEEATIEAVSRS